MRVCIASLHFNPALGRQAPRRYLQELPVEGHLARALAARGHEVEVVLLFTHQARLVEGNITYHFVSGGTGFRPLGQVLGRLLRRQWVRVLPALPALRRIREVDADVIHFHGLLLTLNLAWLWPILGEDAPPVIGHYHGGLPSHRPLVHRLQRYGLRRLSRALFTTHSHARPFVDAGLLIPEQINELMEVSTPFRMRSQSRARRQTAIDGDPVFLWAGRLHPVKDPLTGLQGFARIRAAWAGAQLYVYYLTAELLPELRAFLDAQPALKPHVHFRGRVSHAQMEAIFNSADYFLQASHREYSGFAVLEALACGVLPVVTDIPAFRQMTGNGAHGILFPPGDAVSLAEQVLSRRAIPQRMALRQHFEDHFSFQALAGQLETIYQQVLAERDREGAAR